LAKNGIIPLVIAIYYTHRLTKNIRVTQKINLFFYNKSLKMQEYKSHFNKSIKNQRACKNTAQEEMMKFKSTFFILCVILLSGNIFSQDVPDVVWKTPMSKVYPTGEAYNLPQADMQVSFENPNKETRVINTGEEILVLPPNIRPFPHTATQSEVDAANMSGNAQVIFASWNSYGPSFFGTGFAFSNNGGVSWTGSHQMFTPNNGDPAPFVWPASSTWPGRLGMSVISHGAYSTNNGTSWSTPFAFSPGGGSAFDKNFSAVDQTPGSPFLGRAYTVWTDFTGASGYRIRISFTTNGGVSWSPSTFVSPTASPGHHHQGCDIRVGLNGHVHVVWANCITNGQNSTEDSLGYARSTDGGVSWVVAKNNAVDMNGVRSSNLFNGIRASGFPRFDIDLTGGPRNGWLYSVAAEKNLAPAGDVSDVVLCRSTDNGNTWTRIKVNQDPSNGRFNYMPAVVVTPDGGLNINYYDQRNTTGFVTQTYLSRSLNGGATFTDVQVSDHNFTPAPIPGLAGGYQGDYIGITHAAGKIWPFWADNSSGIYQVWTDGITYGPAPANDVIVGPFLSLPSQFIINNAYSIKARVTNGGTNAQTSLPVRFSVNGVLQTTNTIPSLPPSAIDSTTFSWTPTAPGAYTLRIFSGAAVDENRANDTVTTSVTVLSAPPTVINQCRTNVNLILPDHSTRIDSVLVGIGSACTVTDVDVRIDNFLHTWDADVSFYLQKGNVGVKIVNRVGGSGDNFIGTILDDAASTPIASGTPPFTGTFQPSFPLAPFNGQATDGYWRFVMTDTAGGDTGILNAWCLVLSYDCPVGGIQTVEIPNYYSLDQNYPNPFNPSTSIKYSVPETRLVTLKVFDVLGREVATLVNETKNPGFHTVNFDASNLASGIYFYRIDAGSFSSIKRMVLVK
jgi:hypothetical protein